MKLVLPAAVLLLASAAAVPSARAQTTVTGRSSLGPISPFLGGVPTEKVTPEAIPIPILNAITRALEHNLGVLNAEESVGRAQGARWTALADLLPNVSGRIAENRQKVNLAAFGFPLPPGTPSLVGPFNVFDARVNVTQSVFDRRASSLAQAENHRLAAAELNVKSARDLVVIVSGNLYLEALAAQARVDSARAQLETAQAILDQATQLKASGIVAGIDVLRAQVQLGTEQLRLTSATNDAALTKLKLARVMGLPAGQAYTLSNDIPDLPSPDMTLEQAYERALTTRPDYLAALERVKAAEADRQAAASEYLPSVRVAGDYGTIGNTIGSAKGTYSVSGAVNVPIFNGGRTRGRLLQADADLRMRRSEVEDLKASIDYDVRASFLELATTREQLAVATRSRELAAQQLTQARDRFAAGVASNVEIVQAQEAVAMSSEQYISAAYGYNSAKGSLTRVLGTTEDLVRQLLGGVR